MCYDSSSCSTTTTSTSVVGLIIFLHVAHPEQDYCVWSKSMKINCDGMRLCTGLDGNLCLIRAFGYVVCDAELPMLSVR